MAEDRGEEPFAVETVERVGIGVADAGCHDLDQGFAAASEKPGAPTARSAVLTVSAGIAESAPSHKMTRESGDGIVGTTLTAAFDCSRAAIADLLKSPNGRLVFVASVASLRGVP